MLVTTGAYPRRKYLEGPPNWFALALPSNSKTSLESVSKGKPSSLSGLVISDEGKKFYKIDTRSTISQQGTEAYPYYTHYGLDSRGRPVKCKTNLMEVTDSAKRISLLHPVFITTVKGFIVQKPQDSAALLLFKESLQLLGEK